jgi:SM-20-related protein
MSPPRPSDVFDNIATELAVAGWSVCRDFLPATEIAALAEELQARWADGVFRAARVGSGDHLQLQPDIRNDRVHWLGESAQTPAEEPYFLALEKLRLAINRRLFLGLFSFEGHMTLYPPGSFYRRHLDQFQGFAYRKVSVILYLNPNWEAEHGGQLRIYLPDSGDDGFVDVLPRGGTLAIFLSDRFYHEVLPATRARMSITGWFKVRTEQAGWQ